MAQRDRSTFYEAVGKLNNDKREESARKKALFLTAYGEYGTVLKACEVAGIVRRTYTHWQATDPEFSKDLDQRKQAFGETLEGIALDRVKNPDKNRGSDVLLLGLLNANMPAKYRPQIAMSEDAAKDLIFEWRKASKEVQKQRGDAPADLPAHVEDTLQEILERRGHAAQKRDKSEDGE